MSANKTISRKLVAIAMDVEKMKERQSALIRECRSEEVSQAHETTLVDLGDVAISLWMLAYDLDEEMPKLWPFEYETKN